jgi:hypothetical protein
MLPEAWNSMALVLIGSVLGALASGVWCGCLPRWRWLRSWSALVARNGGAFSDESRPGSHTARFIAESARREAQAKADRLKEVSR